MCMYLFVCVCVFCRVDLCVCVCVCVCKGVNLTVELELKVMRSCPADVKGGRRKKGPCAGCERQGMRRMGAKRQREASFIRQGLLIPACRGGGGGGGDVVSHLLCLHRKRYS